MKQAPDRNPAQPYEATMSSKRDEAAAILAQIPATEEGIRSDKQGDLFFKWTSMTQAQMMKSWRENPNGPTLLTACGGFAAKFAGLIGITGIASIFELEQSLKDSSKAHAWVPASSGADPQPGDILRHSVYHVDVAAGWKGRQLKRVAAGQSMHPRPAKSVEGEFDALKWVTGAAPYNAANLKGWLDLDKYFAAAPSAGPTFGWLNGWWKVWDGSTYYYYFSNGIAKYTKTQPANVAAAPKLANNTGRYTYTAPNELVVTWNRVGGAATACCETFYNAHPSCRQMNANSNLYGPLVATKLTHESSLV
jgi:hypothetical protein